MENSMNFLFKTDAKTVNSTYEFHQIDLDTMLHEGECVDDDEIVFNCTDGELHVDFVDGGNLAVITDKKMITEIFKNRHWF